MRALTALSLTLVLILIAACRDSDPFDQVAYFRGDNRNRVYVLTAPVGTQAGVVQDRVEALFNTAGRFTAVFVFETSTAPPGIQAVTLASDYMAAIDLAYSERFSGWRWRFVRTPTGETNWIDCVRRGNEDLCNP